jgi:hypothetical protein
MRVLRILEPRPTEHPCHSGEDAIRRPAVPMVMKSPDHQSVFFDELTLLPPYGIRGVDALRNIGVIKKRGFVRDDEIVAARRGAL